MNFISGRKSVTGNGFNGIDFLYDRENLAVRRCFLSILAIFTAHTQFRPHYYSSLQFDVFQCTSSPIKTRSFRACDAIFGDFRDDNVCACAVSTLILLSVANLSPEMDSATLIFYQTQTFQLSTNVPGHFEQISQKRKLNYAHAHKSLPCASPKDLLFLSKMNLHTKFD